jgi:hypothetical protein
MKELFQLSAVPGTAIVKKRIDSGILLILSFTLLVFITGILTEFKFSDEIFHYWFARDWFETGQRPLYNHLVDTLEHLGYFRYYVNAPFWHGGLAYLAQLCGGLSKNLAQAYQALHYLLLIVTTGLLAWALYGRYAGRWAALMAATTPLFVSFGVIFFMDMPVAAWTPLVLFLIVRERFVLAGAAFGIMFLTKENAYLLSPAIAALTFLNLQSDRISLKKSGIRDCFKVFMVVLVITAPNFIFRYNHFGGFVYSQDSTFPQKIVEEESPSKIPVVPPETVTAEAPPHPLSQVKEINYIPSDILEEPLDIPRYLGAVLLLLMLLFIVNFRKLYERTDLILLLPMLVYFPLYLIAFKGWLSVRYMSPIIPLAVVLVSKLFMPVPDDHPRGRPSRWLRRVIFFLCLLQFFATLAFVYANRQVSPGERKAMAYIQSSLPPYARLLTPDELLFSFYTGRATFWRSSPRFVDDFFALFWGEGKQIQPLLRTYGTNYLVIREERIYDDSKVRYRMGGGFPRSFVERLPDEGFVKLYENNEVTIWHVVRE